MYRLRMDGDYGAFDPRYGYYLGGADEPGVRVVVSRLFDWRQAVVVVKPDTLIRWHRAKHSGSSIRPRIIKGT